MSKPTPAPRRSPSGDQSANLSQEVVLANYSPNPRPPDPGISPTAGPYPSFVGEDPLAGGDRAGAADFNARRNVLFKPAVELPPIMRLVKRHFVDTLR